MRCFVSAIYRSLASVAVITSALSATPATATEGNERITAKTAPAPKQDKPVFVLIHGAWGNGDGWSKVKPLLEHEGYQVLAPTLPGQGARTSTPPSQIDLSTHINDIITTMDQKNLRRAILVGHSYGGMVVSGVADRIPERIARVVYVDAFLPENGESAFDLMDPSFVQALKKRAATRADGGIPSGSGKGPPQPLATLEQKLDLKSDQNCPVKGTYILTIEPGVRGDAFMPAARRAQSRIWPIYVLQTGHLPQITMAKELASLLHTAALISEGEEPCS